MFSLELGFLDRSDRLVEEMNVRKFQLVCCVKRASSWGAAMMRTDATEVDGSRLCTYQSCPAALIFTPVSIVFTFPTFNDQLPSVVSCVLTYRSL